MPLEFMLLDVVVSDWCSGASDNAPVSGAGFVSMTKPPDEFLEACEVRLYGVTAKGESVCTHVRGFQPSVVFPVEHQPRVGFARVKAFAATRMDGWDPDRTASNFVRVFFDTCAACRRAAQSSHALETKVDVVTQFYDVTGVRACGWVSVSGAVHLPTTHSVHEKVCDLAAVRVLERDDIAPLRVASFDIECVSKTGDFPEVENGDMITCVGVHTWTHGDPTSNAYTAFTVGKCRIGVQT